MKKVRVIGLLLCITVLLGACGETKTTGVKTKKEIDKSSLVIVSKGEEEDTGKKDEEEVVEAMAVSENAEDGIAENAVAEEVIADAYETAAEPEATSVDWKTLYIDYATSWNAMNAKDTYGYDLIYFNDDDIPELVITLKDSSYYAYNIYMIIDGEISQLFRRSKDGYVYDYNNRTIDGRQAQNDVYGERDCILISEGAGGGYSYLTGYALYGTYLEEVFGYSYGYDYETQKGESELSFVNVYGEENRFKEDKDIYFLENEHWPDVENHYTFRYEEMLTLGTAYDLETFINMVSND